MHVAASQASERLVTEVPRRSINTPCVVEQWKKTWVMCVSSQAPDEKARLWSSTFLGRDHPEGGSHRRRRRGGLAKW
ncbi:hypothetical protein [Bradyrhizobium elkanii]|uniref:hypothetical protein n=1 Tax=Bradyrhizobium elkanii TaxID=29448 RepID=UPI0035190708